MQTLLFNAYLDIPNSSGFTPYIGAGAGAAFIKSEGKVMGMSSGDTEAVAAGQVGLGCSYAFNRHVSADLGYRFLFMGDTETVCDPVRLSLRRNSMHQVMLGLRIMF